MRINVCGELVIFFVARYIILWLIDCRKITIIHLLRLRGGDLSN
jgi:hypothetical protein